MVFSSRDPCGGDLCRAIFISPGNRWDSHLRKYSKRTMTVEPGSWVMVRGLIAGGASRNCLRRRWKESRYRRLMERVACRRSRPAVIWHRRLPVRRSRHQPRQCLDLTGAAKRLRRLIKFPRRLLRVRLLLVRCSNPRLIRSRRRHNRPILRQRHCRPSSTTRAPEN